MLLPLAHPRKPVAATNRRASLVSQLREEVDQGARAGIQQRLDLLDQRILQLESDQASTERQLSGAGQRFVTQLLSNRRDAPELAPGADRR